MKSGSMSLLLLTVHSDFNVHYCGLFSLNKGKGKGKGFIRVILLD